MVAFPLRRASDVSSSRRSTHGIPAALPSEVKPSDEHLYRVYEGPVYQQAREGAEYRHVLAARNLGYIHDRCGCPRGCKANRGRTLPATPVRHRVWGTSAATTDSISDHPRHRRAVCQLRARIAQSQP